MLISSNFHIWIASIKLWFMFEYEFCPTKSQPRWSTKWLPPTNFHSWPYLFVNWLLPNFVYGLLLSNFEYGFGQLTKMASKFAPTYRFALVDTKSFWYHQFSYLLLLSYSLAQHWIWVLSDEQSLTWLQKWSVCTCGDFNLVHYYPISSKFHIWTTFLKLGFIFEYVFCMMNITKILMHLFCNSTSDWITSKICYSISCNIL